MKYVEIAIIVDFSIVGNIAVIRQNAVVVDVSSGAIIQDSTAIELAGVVRQ